MLSGLFHRGFSQSGNALLPWTIVENPMSKTKVIAEGAKCNIASTTEMIKCLKEKPVKTLVQTVSKLYVVGDAFPPSPFGPVIEKSGKTPFLPEHPYKIISDGKLVNDVPWVTSNVKNEGLFAVEGKKLNLYNAIAFALFCSFFIIYRAGNVQNNKPYF